MAFVQSKPNFLLFQFFLLPILIISITVLAKNDSTKLMYNKPVAVQGYVYCKACQHIGFGTLEDSGTPLAGALVRLECKDKKNPIIQEANFTTKKGYFSIKTKQPLTTLRFEQCKVSIVSSPTENCNVPTDMNGGVTGAFLKLSHKVNADTTKPSHDFEVFAVGPFAFQAARLETCGRRSRVLAACNPDCVLICSRGECSCPGGACIP